MKPNSVSLIVGTDEWIVTVVEGGEELHQFFKIRSHAQSWSDGQRIRLGLPVGQCMASFLPADD